MPEIKTKKNDQKIDLFLSGIKDAGQREDCFVLLKIFENAVREKPAMWGSSIVGFGQHQDWMVTGFSPRKGKIAVYLMSGMESAKIHLKSLGKSESSKSCLYIRSLKDIDVKVLEKILKSSARVVKSSLAKKAEK